MGSMTKLEKARRASGITLEGASSIVGVSMPTLMMYQKEPSKMTFGQFFALAAEMDGDAKDIIAGTLDEVEAQATEWKPLRDLTLGEFFAARNSLDKLGRELNGAKRRTFA